MACFGDCFDIGPPPDMILSMPPPPLPSFLLPRSAIFALSGNDTQPCFAAFMCEPSPGPREQAGIELIELSRKGPIGFEDTWLFVLISSCVGVLLLGALLAMILMKCRETYSSYTYQDTTIKQPPMPALGDGTINPKPNHHNFLSNGTMLYPVTNGTASSTVTLNNHHNHLHHNIHLSHHTLQQQMANDNRMLWAALTPHGTTRHYVSESFPNAHLQQPQHHLEQDHYEVIDYSIKPEIIKANPTAIINRTPVKSSFDNSGFIDYDYEDPTPLLIGETGQILNNYHIDDMDSGYQEPSEVIGTLSRNSPRPIVSSPTRIEHPNIPPLNLYPHHRSSNCSGNTITTTLNGGGGTLNKNKTLSRRVSDASSSLSYGREAGI